MKSKRFNFTHEDIIIIKTTLNEICTKTLLRSQIKIDLSQLHVTYNQCLSFSICCILLDYTLKTFHGIRDNFPNNDASAKYMQQSPFEEKKLFHVSC